MTLLLRHWKGTGILLGAMAGTAGLTLVLLTALGVDLLDTRSADRGSGSELIEGPLMTANRDKLYICVSSAGTDPSLEAAVKSRVEAALVELSKDPAWVDAGLAEVESEVNIGCPAEPAAFEPGVRLIPTGNGGVFVDPFPVVDEASLYRIFVFVVPAESITSAFAEFLPTTAEEFLRRGDMFDGVTGGIYVSADAVNESSCVEELIAASLGTAAPTTACR